MNLPADTPKIRRVIKRYSNRKLYDTRDSCYVTLLQIARMVREGEHIQVIDNTTKEDKTEVTLALAISEELRARHRSVPLAMLRGLIQQRGGKLLSSLRDGPIGKLIPDESDDVVTKHENVRISSVSANLQSSGAATPSAASCRVPEPSELSQKRTNAHDKVSPEKTVPFKSDRSSLADIVASSRHTLDQWQHAIDERVRAVLPNVSLLLDIQSEVRKLHQRVVVLEQKLQQLQSAQSSQNTADSRGFSGLSDSHLPHITGQDPNRRE